MLGLLRSVFRLVEHVSSEENDGETIRERGGEPREIRERGEERERERERERESRSKVCCLKEDSGRISIPCKVSWIRG